MLAFLLLIAAPQSLIYGAGLQPCGAWLDARTGRGALSEASLLTWLAGYLSAVNDYGRRGDVLRGARLQDAAYWIDGWCRTNPTATVKAAADAFVDR